VLWGVYDKTNIIVVVPTEETFVLALETRFSWLLISLVIQFVMNILVSLLVIFLSMGLILE
jgi:hypothetical protein